jgi:hypothetical protein
MKTPPSGQKPVPEHGLFRRSLSPLHNRLTASTCKKCRSFVAASIRPELLDFMEKLHLCILGSNGRANWPTPRISM